MNKIFSCFRSQKLLSSGRGWIGSLKDAVKRGTSYLSTVGARLLFFNFIFFAYAVFMLSGISWPVLNLFVNMLIFIIPGSAWIGVFKNRIKDDILLIFMVLGLSTLALFGIWISHAVFGIKVTALSNFISLVFITNIGIFFNKKSYFCGIGDKNNWKKYVPKITFLLPIYIFILWGTEVVPVFKDVDWEVPSPSYSLITNVIAYSQINLVEKDFAVHHPLLGKFYTGYAMLLSGMAEKTFFYYETILGIYWGKFKLSESVGLDPLTLKDPQGNDARAEFRRLNNSGLKAKMELPSGERMEFVLRENPGMSSLPFVSPWQDCYHLFIRIINPFLGILISAIIYYLTHYLTRSALLSVLAAFLVFSFPVVFVEYSIGSSVAISTVFLLFMCYFYILGERDKSSYQYIGVAQFVSAVLSAMCDLKAIIFPIAVGIKEIMSCLRKKTCVSEMTSKSGRNIILGFLLGTLLWWGYAISLSPSYFIEKHLHKHLLDRVLHLGINDSSYHPLKELWISFFEQFNFAPLMMTAMVISIWKKIASREGILLFWFITGALAFSSVDYRQVQHLTLIIPPLIISSILFVSSQRRILRYFLVSLIILLALYNLQNIYKYSADFTSMKQPVGW